MRVPPDFIYTLPPPLVFLVVLVAVSVVALLIQSVLRFKRVARQAEELSKITTAVCTIAGAIFGLSMTFLANSVWNTEDSAQAAVNAEARAIRVMDLYMDSLTAPAYDGISKLLADYGNAVAAEWDQMSEDDYGTPAETALRTIYRAVINGLADGDQNRLLQQRLLTALDAVSTARQERLSVAENFVSPSQWTLVTVLAMVLLFLVTASHAAFPLARKVSIAAIVLAISVMLYVIVLHDRPFIGYAAVTPGPILKATGVDP